MYPIIIQLIHFVADFLCQTREMATNKSKSLYWLTLHVSVYTTVTTLSWLVFSTNIITLTYVWFITFISHWVTDFCTSKGTAYFYLKNNMFGFFGLIGFDQLIHATTLILTYNYFIK
jgi:hypothetical protein